MIKGLSKLSEVEALQLLDALGLLPPEVKYHAEKSDNKEEFRREFEEVFDEIGDEEPEETEEKDLLGDLTASYILDGLDVTRKDTLLMVLFDNRLRASLGEKITYHINLVYR